MNNPCTYLVQGERGMIDRMFSEGEYVPPKADVVENKEEDAKISLK